MGNQAQHQNNERVETAMFNDHRLATVFHDAGGRDLVVFCHGFQSQKTGPSRLFVRAARMLAPHGISSLRFDQLGCGDSEGESDASSFDDWVGTTRAIAEHYLDTGYRVALFGQSMGGAAVIGVAAELHELMAIVAWSPGANVDVFVPSPSGFVEEGGQLVRDSYWREAHDARIAEKFGRLHQAAYVVFGTADHLVDEKNRRALIERAGSTHRIDVFEGYAHSAWSYEQATEILKRSCDFLLAVFDPARDKSS
jgi:esterase/lipase